LGDGAVDFRAFRSLVEATGFDGPVEVEIFNEALWARDGAEVLAEVASRYAEHAC
ncbi:sugar phosphate isomerase/epimerase, partial [Streptomyces sp. NPDC001948]